MGSRYGGQYRDAPAPDSANVYVCVVSGKLPYGQNKGVAYVRIAGSFVLLHQRRTFDQGLPHRDAPSWKDELGIAARVSCDTILFRDRCEPTTTISPRHLN